MRVSIMMIATLSASSRISARPPQISRPAYDNVPGTNRRLPARLARRTVNVNATSERMAIRRPLDGATLLMSICRQRESVVSSTLSLWRNVAPRFSWDCVYMYV